MSPSALVNALLYDRGLTDAVELPVEFRVDGSHRLRFHEPMPGLLEVRCVLDGVLAGGDPGLQANLLRWNLLAAVVGGGSLGVEEDGRSVVMRLALPTEALALETLKSEVHALLVRAERLEGVLVTNPLDYEAGIPDEPANPSAPPPPAFGGGGVIRL